MAHFLFEMLFFQIVFLSIEPFAFIFVFGLLPPSLLVYMSHFFACVCATNNSNIIQIIYETINKIRDQLQFGFLGDSLKIDQRVANGFEEQGSVSVQIITIFDY